MNEETTATDPEVLAPAELPPPRPVQYGEIFKYAKKKCKTCSGRGQFVIAQKTYRPGPLGLDKNGKPTAKQLPIVGKDWPTEAKICGCALTRFIQARGTEIIRYREGGLFWKT